MIDVDCQGISHLRDEECQQLMAEISLPRAETYLEYAHHDDRAAATLYGLNQTLALYYFELSGAVEVALRNRIHEIFTQSYGDDWFPTVQSLITPSRKNDIDKARDDIRRKALPDTPGQMVANLGFGFWVSFFENKNERRFWNKGLFKIFKRGRSRRQVHEKLVRLRDLRNRIAHHEPIFNQPHLATIWQESMDILNDLSPIKSKWLHHRTGHKVQIALGDLRPFSLNGR